MGKHEVGCLKLNFAQMQTSALFCLLKFAIVCLYVQRNVPQRCFAVCSLQLQTSCAAEMLFVC